MRDPNRIRRIIEKIYIIWSTHPDMRLLQLVLGLIEQDKDPFYVEDDTLEAMLDKMIENMKKGLSP